METARDFWIGISIASFLVGIFICIRAMWNLRKLDKDNKYTGRKP